MGSREVQVESVFVTDPATLQTARYVKGDTIPDGVEVGAHVFREPESSEGNFVVGPTGGFHPAAGALAGTPVEDGGSGDDSGDGDLVARALERDTAGVKTYADNHPDRVEALLAAERDGQNRKGVVSYLESKLDSSSS